MFLWLGFVQLCSGASFSCSGMMTCTNSAMIGGVSNLLYSGCCVPDVPLCWLELVHSYELRLFWWNWAVRYTLILWTVHVLSSSFLNIVRKRQMSHAVTWRRYFLDDICIGGSTKTWCNLVNSAKKWVESGGGGWGQTMLSTLSIVERYTCALSLGYVHLRDLK